MATTVAHLQALLTADTRDFDRAMSSSEQRTKSLGRAATVAGVAIFAGLGVLAKRGFTEISDSQKVMAQTAAGIKSTGGAANVTAKGVANLSARLSEMSGIDDEVIQQSANLLLTFRKVHNEAGRGNRIFDRATQAALDLSVRGFGSMDSTAKMLGKALEDPVRGMTALRRAGVTFTDAQKETIKSLVKSGDLLGAQKLILGEVEKQVGGSAKAYGDTLPGEMAKARNAFDEVAAELVTSLLPVMTSLLKKFSEVIGWLKEHPGVAKAAAIALGILATALLAVRTATLLMNLAFLANPIALVVLAIAALVAGLILAYRRSETFRDIINAMWGVLKAVGAWIMEWAPRIGGWLVDAFKVSPLGILITHLDDLWGWLKKLAGWVRENGGKMLAPLITAFDKLKDIIKWIADKVEWLIDNIGKLDRLNPFGDARNPNMTLPPQGPVGSGRMDISPRLWDELAGAQRFGLVLTSGYRPGAITASGTPSDHGVYPSKAIDVSGSSGAMARFFTWLIGQRDVKQAFYDPLGSIFGGILSSYREGGHSDHVHVATYDRGGFLRPGWNLAYNGTGAPERVGGGGNITFNFPNYVGSRQDLMAAMQNMAQEFKRRNGKSPF